MLSLTSSDNDTAHLASGIIIAITSITHTSILNKILKTNSLEEERVRFAKTFMHLKVERQINKIFITLCAIGWTDFMSYSLREALNEIWK